MDALPPGFDARSTRRSESVTNLPDVDAAWPVLVRLGFDLCDRLAMSGAGEEIEARFQDVADQAVAIFRREESAMASSEDPHRTIHRQGHLAILSILARSRSEAREQGPSPMLALRLRAELLGFLREHHVLLDGLLGRHIRAWARDGAGSGRARTGGGNDEEESEMTG